MLTVHQLAKTFRLEKGEVKAVNDLSFQVVEGEVYGLMGPNGAGKTTALKSILGLTPFDGELQVLGRDPRTERDSLMKDVCFIADVAVLPKWLRVDHALDYVAGVHPKFDRQRADEVLARTDIKRKSKVGELSKGMITQLHLALIMAIDAKLLVHLSMPFNDTPSQGCHRVVTRRCPQQNGQRSRG
jgi:ABC-2 type transport system ATP-binding protein